MRTERTRTRLRRLAAGAVAACGVGVIADAWAQQPPTAKPAPTPAAVADDFSRPVAYIYKNVPITRGEFGEFLMARGGVDKLELFVNKKIIEHECARRGVVVTKDEMEAALLEDLAGLSIKKKEFIEMVLPRYGKTLYEWMEDVIRPRLLLSKLCKDRVQVTDEDLKQQFEREYGEKRRVQIIVWPKGDDLKAIEKEYAKLRTSQDEFDRAARGQSNPSLAAACGHIKPIARHTCTYETEKEKDRAIEEKAFKLTVGEVSEIIGTSQGYVVMKLHEVVPPDASVKFEAVKERLKKQAYDERMSQEIPKYFAELKKAAEPNFIFTGPELWKVLTGPDRNPESVLQGVSGTAPPEKK
jgi:hypothetical protein